MQIGAKRANTCTQCVHVPTEFPFCIPPLLVGSAIGRRKKRRRRRNLLLRREENGEEERSQEAVFLTSFHPPHPIHPPSPARPQKKIPSMSARSPPRWHCGSTSTGCPRKKKLIPGNFGVGCAFGPWPFNNIICEQYVGKVKVFFWGGEGKGEIPGTLCST